jgi:hypothetical protein
MPPETKEAEAPLPNATNSCAVNQILSLSFHLRSLTDRIGPRHFACHSVIFLSGTTQCGPSRPTLQRSVASPLPPAASSLLAASTEWPLAPPPHHSPSDGVDGPQRRAASMQLRLQKLRDPNLRGRAAEAGAVPYATCARRPRDAVEPPQLDVLAAPAPAVIQSVHPRQRACFHIATASARSIAQSAPIHRQHASWLMARRSSTAAIRSHCTRSTPHCCVASKACACAYPASAARCRSADRQLPCWFAATCTERRPHRSDLPLWQ